METKTVMIPSANHHSISKESYGTITFTNEVIATMAGAAAIGTPGVVGMCGNIFDGFVELLGRKNLSKGVKIFPEEGAVSVEASIVVQYGAVIPSIVQNMRNRIITVLESMAGLCVSSINIRIQALSLTAEETSDKSDSVQIPALSLVSG